MHTRSEPTRTTRHALIALPALLALCACGGSSNVGTDSHGPGGAGAGFVERGENVARFTDLPEIEPEHAGNMPIYHDDRKLMVGVDPATDVARALDPIPGRSGVRIRYGQTRLGGEITEEQLREAFEQVDKRRLFMEASSPGEASGTALPTVHIAGPMPERMQRSVVFAVQSVNAALPHGYAIAMGEPLPRKTFDSDGAAAAQQLLDEPAGRIYVTYDEGLAGAVQYTQRDGARQSMLITMSETPYATERTDAIVIARALVGGLQNHQGAIARDSEIASILRSDVSIYDTAQTPNRTLPGRPPMSLLHPVDRALLGLSFAICAGQPNCVLPDAPRTLPTVTGGGGFSIHIGAGEPPPTPPALDAWTTTSTHLHASNRIAEAGVVWRNGVAKPYAFGPMAEGPLRLPSGTATWTGALVGFTPHANAVTGDASIVFDLGAGSADGVARFTSMEAWAAHTAPGAPGTGSPFEDAAYALELNGSTYHHASEEATVTGIFVGDRHQGAAGTLRRDDLTASFVAAR